MKDFKFKILLSILLISSVLIGVVSPISTQTANADEYGIMLISANIDDSTIGEKIVETALYLEELHPYRGSGTDEESATAETLAGMLESYGFEKLYSSYIDEFLYTPLVDTSNTTTVTTQHKTSRNVVGYINNNCAQTIIIGAHYDNYYYDGEEGNTGFYTNLLGVAGALEIAYELSQQEDLGYNIMVSFWGAEEDGLHGSEYFVSSLTSSELSSIALYVNLDSLAVGDNLYIYTNEIADYHEEFFIEEAENLGYDLNAPPEDKQYTLGMLSERPFMHMGISSDNFYFTTNEVMCANFFSYVWEDGVCSESLTNSDVIYTGNDNSQYIFEVHTKEAIETSMTQVSEIIIATLSRDDIMTVLATAKETSQVHEIFYDDSFTTIVSVIMVAVFALLAVLKIRKLSKEVKAPESEIEYSAPSKVENVELFGETVILEDGALKRKNTSQNPYEMSDNGESDKPSNPFDF
ncbi:MAG: M28 family peptidase [Bacillota bacterium]